MAQRAYKPRNLLTEGKTKIVYDTDDSNIVVLQSKDDITAGDGKKKDNIVGKGKLATTTTVNCFKHLAFCGVPTHFIEQVGETSFAARAVDMIPIEVVVRAIATGSAPKRDPSLVEGQILPELVVEFFLKDDANHDPIMVWDEEEQAWALHDPKVPISPDSLLGYWDGTGEACGRIDLNVANTLREIATKTFVALEEAWRQQGVTLVDLKIECGKDKATGQIIVADVADNDSWRIWPNGEVTRQLDKDVYRHDGDLTEVKKNYALVAEMTGKFPGALAN